MKLTKEVIEFCAEAYEILKDETSERACHIKLGKDAPQYIKYMMQKKSWYYGEWALFEHNIFSCTVCEDLLIELSTKKEKERNATN